MSKPEMKRVDGTFTSTQYTEEQIATARDEWESAYVELTVALDDAETYMIENGYERLPNFWVPCEDDPKGMAIRALTTKISNAVSDCNPLREQRRSHRHTNEYQPVRKCLKQAATIRNYARKLKALLEN